jgi:hypothetical protein
MAKVRKEAVATSIKLDKDLRKQIQPFLSLREFSFTVCVEKALRLYMETNPLTTWEKEFLKNRKNSTNK